MDLETPNIYTERRGPIMTIHLGVIFTATQLSNFYCLEQISAHESQYKSPTLGRHSEVAVQAGVKRKATNKRFTKQPPFFFSQGEGF